MSSSASRLLVRNLPHPSRRCLHASHRRQAITNLEMPAMSPTMTEGGIAGWKKAEGENFTAGDVLLEIETDKATIDVEAQEDGVMGKIILQDGAKNIPVGKIIALLAEEGDDISNLSAPPESESTPKESSSSSAPPPASEAKQTPALQASSSSSHSHGTPTHSRPLFPSVLRLLQENGVSDAEKIKGTGVRGMLTKGDVLAFLGKASSPFGTFKEDKPAAAAPTGAPPKAEPVKALDGAAVRRLIVSNLLRDSVKARTPASAVTPTFDSLIEDYLGRPSPSSVHVPASKLAPLPTQSTEAYFEGLL